MSIFDKDWRSMRLGSLDTETTGLKPGVDRLTEIGIVYFEGGKPVDKFQRLINPEIKINAKAAQVSGITDQMVADKKPLKKMRKKILQKLNDCDIWVAHNEAFDRSFLRAEFERVGLTLLEKPILDTRVFADFLWPKGPNNLDAVVQRLRIIPPSKMLKRLKINKQRHRADYDALLCGLALYMFAERLPTSLGDALVVQDWMFRSWFKYVRLGDKRYQRMLEPFMHRGYKK